MRSPWTDRPVLVTGATGLVGSWLCEALIAAGARVTAMILDEDRHAQFFRARSDRRCTIVRGNLADLADCMRAINIGEAEAVFHLGAQTIVGTALRDPLECFESNIRGTYNLLEAARRLTPLVRSFVVASSDKAYGDSPVLPYVESMPLQGRHPYDVSKSCTDLLALSYYHTYGLPVTVARCGNIYGGGDLNWSRIIPGTIRSILRNEPPVLRSDGGPVRDYLYVRDVVDAYLTLALSADRAEVRGEAFNFSPQSRCTVRDVVDAIAHAMDVQVTPRILNTARFEIRDQTLDATKARERLNWTPKWSLDEGLRETVGWYRTMLAEEIVAAP